jgi:transcriptional regulator GlxA family with amidase domain
MSPLRSRSRSAIRFEVPVSSNGSSPAVMNETNGTNGTIKRDVLPIAPIVVSTQEVRIRKILKLIESEPARSIEELAAQCNLSHSHLQHLFKQHTGVQLGHLLLEQRLLKAACLLENSNMSVKEIAFAVGYEHTSSFIRAFERRFGIAPRTYRIQADRRKC